MLREYLEGRADLSFRPIFFPSISRGACLHFCLKKDFFRSIPSSTKKPTVVYTGISRYTSSRVRHRASKLFCRRPKEQCEPALFCSLSRSGSVYPQVWLPPKDDVLAPGVFNQGTPGPRWFDFSSAPDVDGFNSSACSADITWAGQRAFRMHQREQQRKGSRGALRLIIFVAVRLHDVLPVPHVTVCGVVPQTLTILWRKVVGAAK